MNSPLADKLRPESFDDVVGQQHLISEGKVLYNLVESGHIPNMIFYGPSGVGKTTVAKIIAKKTNKNIHILNGTNASTTDIKAIIGEIDSFIGMSGTLLYLDEIQYLNKKQQQSLLEYIENGKITLIASTTENPYFYIYNAILSRSTIFEFKPVSPADIKKAVLRGIDYLSKELGAKINIDDKSVDYICYSCGQDVRKALNALEISVYSAKQVNSERKIDFETVKMISQKSSNRYDRDGDMHFDILSAFQKSIRGSDENAALHYLARLIAADDLPSICRRLLVIAAEDIGLAYPQAIAITKACVDSALQLGFPEARIPLAEAVIMLATAPKSNSVVTAIDEALNDVNNGISGDIPDFLKDSHYSGSEKLGHGIDYKYPHNYPDNYIYQQYLPDEIKDKVYYKYGSNKLESITRKYWEDIKKRNDKK